MKNKVLSEIKVSYCSGGETKTKITGSNTAYNLILACWNKGTIELQEEFKVLLLNRANQVLGIYPVSRGGVSGTLVDAKLVFSVSLKCNASGIILVHNHPSGNLKPSESDKKLTQKLSEAGKFLDIQVLDHLIITPYKYFSFSDEGLMI
ncbi:RadC family protein [Zunongwangia sp. H14]|uniref:JAB domain-containing protein n=1 Tax=Zunongwangia sp. H14 TaxID=3240792 RepID=UPI003569E9FC